MTGKLFSAYPMDGFTVTEIAAKFSEHMGADVELTQVTDPSLVAGFVVQIGFLRFDHSARASLKEMARHLHVNV